VLHFTNKKGVLSVCIYKDHWARVVYWPAWEVHCNSLKLVLGSVLVRVSSGVRIRVKVRVSVMVTGLALEQAGWRTSPYFAVTGQ